MGAVYQVEKVSGSFMRSKKSMSNGQTSFPSALNFLLGYPQASDTLGIRTSQQNEGGLKLDITSDSRKFGGGDSSVSSSIQSFSSFISYLLAHVIV